jgi:hypothetical protein
VTNFSARYASVMIENLQLTGLIFGRKGAIRKELSDKVILWTKNTNENHLK